MQRRPDVIAAGAVVWRERNDGLEVLLVHRPRFDDWSWPKGKREGKESIPATAVREVLEETGIRIALGRSLPTAHYRVGESTDKAVYYWAARGPSGALPAPPRPDEVDRTRWCTVDEADRMLTRHADRTQLLSVVQAHEEGALDTYPVVIVRHGHARPKSAWGREDSARPLVSAGQVQARALAQTLAAFGITRVLSSPWKRCLQTVAPFVAAGEVKVRQRKKLSEDGYRRDRKGTAALIAKHLGRGRAVAICTHRPVLGTIFGVMAGHAEPGRSAELPSKDPFLAPGEILVAHLTHHGGRVVAVETHRTRST